MGRLSQEIQQDYILALKTLGYSQSEIKQAFGQVGTGISDQMPLNEGIKVLLAHL